MHHNKKRKRTNKVLARPSCPETGKTSHNGKLSAMISMDWIQRQRFYRGNELHVYCCPYCGKWHVGSRK